MNWDEDRKLCRIFNPGDSDWRAEEAKKDVEAALRDAVPWPEVDPVFLAGYAAAFERLIRADDLAALLSNFAVMLQRKAEPTNDYWSTEARLFVSKLDASPHMTRWFPDWNAPRVSDPALARKRISLNDAACDVLYREEAEEAERAKEAEV